MENLFDLWYLLALLVFGGCCIGLIYLGIEAVKFISDEWNRFRKKCRRKARMKERARRYRAGI